MINKYILYFALYGDQNLKENIDKIYNDVNNLSVTNTN